MIDEFLTLIEIVKREKLYSEVAKLLNIKKESVRREINRILIYYNEGEKTTKQKRSGKRSWERYREAMSKIVMEKHGIIRTGKMENDPGVRVLVFRNYNDMLNYTQPIRQIVSVNYSHISDNWYIYIPAASR